MKSKGNPTESISVQNNAVLEKALVDENAQVIDVRKPGEYNSSHITDVENRPLDLNIDSVYEWDKDKTYYIHCAGGYRSVIFESILKSKGIHNVIDIAGGYGAIKVNPNISHCENVCENS